MPAWRRSSARSAGRSDRWTTRGSSVRSTAAGTPLRLKSTISESRGDSRRARHVLARLRHARVPPRERRAHRGPRFERERQAGLSEGIPAARQAGRHRRARHALWISAARTARSFAASGSPARRHFSRGTISASVPSPWYSGLATTQCLPRASGADGSSLSRKWHWPVWRRPGRWRRQTRLEEAPRQPDIHANPIPGRGARHERQTAAASRSSVSVSVTVVPPPTCQWRLASRRSCSRNSEGRSALRRTRSRRASSSSWRARGRSPSARSRSQPRTPRRCDRGECRDRSARTNTRNAHGRRRSGPAGRAAGPRSRRSAVQAVLTRRRLANRPVVVTRHKSRR